VTLSATLVYLGSRLTTSFYSTSRLLRKLAL